MRKGWKIQSPAIIPGLPTTHHLKSAIHEGISITSMLVSDMSQWNLCRLKRGGNGFIFLGNCSSWISMIHEATSNIMDFIEKYPGLPFTIPHARRLVSDTCLSFRPIMWVAPRRRNKTCQTFSCVFSGHFVSVWKLLCYRIDYTRTCWNP